MQQQAGTAARDELVTRALRLVTVSVIFGVLSGAVSVITGLRDGSLGVFAVGLGVFADVIGSAVLWRFRAERRHPASPHAREESAAVIVGIALAMVAVVLAAESAAALASGTHPGSSAVPHWSRVRASADHAITPRAHVRGAPALTAAGSLGRATAHQAPRGLGGEGRGQRVMSGQSGWTWRESLV